jgi:hypothetical protein
VDEWTVRLEWAGGGGVWVCVAPGEEEWGALRAALAGLVAATA